MIFFNVLDLRDKSISLLYKDIWTKKIDILKHVHSHSLAKKGRTRKKINGKLIIEDLGRLVISLEFFNNCRRLLKRICPLLFETLQAKSIEFYMIAQHWWLSRIVCPSISYAVDFLSWVSATTNFFQQLHSAILTSFSNTKCKTIFTCNKSKRIESDAHHLLLKFLSLT